MIKRAEQKIADDTEQKVCGVRITGITTGKIVDYGVRDSMNMEPLWLRRQRTVFRRI